ncbi:D-isomer specific 2-hydroxyacid dehydrogenase family protein [Nocardia sp. NBC_00565]|uniref:D-isomer specific 2-hydroxyacid dehydrogenase family protein n=1 Tax=Nocardia sp. NBC_00565 TaxID=2975993 RepID=UPI002E81395E|nr:D-isomer specific 2-hydroxyacid dehydrogenase family protein [Nocardia sp. NBC_00565]WUC05489.1 D-isomer specific 2-hydroxyacid dehydrogenase family protein [Nocardia sp. NBC_00565]
MLSTTAPRIHLGPNRDPALAWGIEQGGGVLVPLEYADAVVWSQGPDTFPDRLPSSVRWVQLPSAGVEPWISAGIVDERRVWTSAAGVYARNVAEHGVALLLAGVRALAEQVRATSWRKAEFDHRVATLHGATVAIVGCGGIGRAMIPLLTAFGAKVLAVTRSGVPVPGASETVDATRTTEIWSRADHFVLAAPATSETAQLVDAAALAGMKSTAWIVNVARGALIDTDALVRALADGSIGGAALDVTDPEPLPEGHPLWTLPNAIVTPHVANPKTGLTAVLADHVSANVERFAAGQPLLATIDIERGY